MSKVVLISGTTRGLGLDLARRYVGGGFQVYGCGRGDDNIGRDGYKHFCVDLQDEKQISSMFRNIRKETKYIDILINNAAVAGMNQFMLMPDSVNSHMLSVNVAAMIAMIREGSKLMMNSPSGYGRVVNFSSVAVFHALEGQLAYSASKAAVEHITRTASKELASVNITVNCVRLPYLRTSMSRSIGADRIKALIQLQTVKRQCTFDDISYVTDMLTDERSGFITGETFNLGGV
jgi:3-oxoacyl-[acyl-carrier protein] reductase